MGIQTKLRANPSSGGEELYSLLSDIISAVEKQDKEIEALKKLKPSPFAKP